MSYFDRAYRIIGTCRVCFGDLSTQSTLAPFYIVKDWLCIQTTRKHYRVIKAAYIAFNLPLSAKSFNNPIIHLLLFDVTLFRS